MCCSDAESWSLKEILALADIETRDLWEALSLGYTESPGHPLLRNEISQLYSMIDRDSVLTFAGAEEGIYCLMRTLINPGDHVITIEPCYQSLAALPRALGANLTSVFLDPKRQWQLDISELRKAFRPNTKLLIMNYPHNPTGALLSQSDYDEVIALARQSGAYIFCDEVYRYMEIDETKRVPSIADAYEKGIALNVLTKAFGLAGLRIGWLASQDRTVINKVGEYKLYTTICNSAPSEILAIIALRAKEVILKRNRGIVLHNYQLLQKFMHKQSKLLAWVPPQSGTVASMELLHPMPVSQFAEELLEKEGVLVMPGDVIDLPKKYFRIGFGRKNLPDILDRFEQFIGRLCEF